GIPCSFASTATVYVPILLATSPLAAMRSAPTTIAPILPCRIIAPAMLSEITVVGMLSFINSQAVRREPWRNGRVSSAYTWIFLPCSTAARITPSAVPYPQVASAPALQWVSTPPEAGGGEAPLRPPPMQGAMSSACIFLGFFFLAPCIFLTLSYRFLKVVATP